MRWSGPRALAIPAALFLACCAPAPQPVSPALWEVTGPTGERAWLFGTVHALERPAAWRTKRIADALARADSIVVEVRDVGDGTAMAKAFTRLARSQDREPLDQRVSPEQRPALAHLIRQGRTNARDLAAIDTWAAAIVLARASSPDLEPGNGIDRAVIAAAAGRPVIELEGATTQLGIFDNLPEVEQRDMLALVIRDANRPDASDRDLAKAWRSGDFAAIEAETRTGLLADPELREALFTRRNAVWSARVLALLRQGRQPFVAVGAAHMAGSDGLPALLERRGLTVRRIQ